MIDWPFLCVGTIKINQAWFGVNVPRETMKGSKRGCQLTVRGSRLRRMDQTPTFELVKARQAYVIAQLRDAAKDQWETIAEKSGVPLPTLIKIARGQTKNPTLQTLDLLLRYYGQI
jgi:hypothetical protein